jgi:hypothetical protein
MILEYNGNKFEYHLVENQTFTEDQYNLYTMFYEKDGHTDWRLPTAGEAYTIRMFNSDIRLIFIPDSSSGFRDYGSVNVVLVRDVNDI